VPAVNAEQQVQEVQVHSEADQVQTEPVQAIEEQGGNKGLLSILLVVYILFNSFAKFFCFNIWLIISLYVIYLFFFPDDHQLEEDPLQIIRGR